MRRAVNVFADRLERHQVAGYLLALAAGMLVGVLAPGADGAFEALIYPVLGALLYATFLQVPFTALRAAFSDRRFLLAALGLNFLVVPPIAFALSRLAPGGSAVELGVLMVLLTPCIDYVVTFAHLGKVDARPLLAATPLLLAAQMVLLPVYLGLFMGDAAAGLVRWQPFVHAFVWLIVVPLSIAAMCQAWAARSTAGQRVVAALGLLPVPATAALLFVVVAALAPQLGLALDAVRQVTAIYLVFAIAAPVLGWGIARCWRLPADQGRAVAFSSATRNSLVVLPLGLAIPGAVPWVPAVILTQTLVELVSELVYVRVMPGLGVNALHKAPQDR